MNAFQRLAVCVPAVLLAACTSNIKQESKAEDHAQALPQAQPQVEALSATSPTLREQREAYPSGCPSSIDNEATKSLGKNWATPAKGACKTKMSHSYPIPDASCTPGAVNPTLTDAVFADPHFKTSCVRDELTSHSEKNQTYTWYAIAKPANNSGATMTCELDHLVPLVVGGADSLDNIWPQCGPKGVTRAERYFPQKDCVELYLADEVRSGKMKLLDAQKKVAEDWTQFLDVATTTKGKPCMDESDSHVR